MPPHLARIAPSTAAIKSLPWSWLSAIFGTHLPTMPRLPSYGVGAVPAGVLLLQRLQYMGDVVFEDTGDV